MPNLLNELTHYVRPRVAIRAVPTATGIRCVPVVGGDPAVRIIPGGPWLINMGADHARPAISVANFQHLNWWRNRWNADRGRGEEHAEEECVVLVARAGWFGRRRRGCSVMPRGRRGRTRPGSGAVRPGRPAGCRPRRGCRRRIRGRGGLCGGRGRTRWPPGRCWRAVLRPR